MQAPSAEIIVTGKRLLEAQAICIRSGCTPLRDAQVSIALAEAQFRQGRYLVSRRTLSDAVARNRDAAATDPKPVAALYEALATVALHEGDQDVYRRAVAGRVHTLRDNLPAQDPLVVAATPALGDMWIKLGNYPQAIASYRTAERAATAAGQDGAAMLAAIKQVWLTLAIGQPSRARRMLAEIETRPIAQDPGMQVLVRVMRFRLDVRDADDAEMAKLVDALGQTQAAKPVLLWAPDFPRDAVEAANAESRKFGRTDVIRTGSAEVAANQWVDVGFWVRPDGRTAEVEILRGSRSALWTRPMLAQIEARRYAQSAAGSDGASDGPSDGGAAAGGVYRVERITKRSAYTTPVGSLIRRRVSADGFETLDLTEATSPSKATAL
ncbi:hypothetical protein VH567_12690 [Sphingomonas sp. 4RDLI-65]|uniref:tetratricopeptide repeat protein n=1 Tax=Sphingomonas sp. 4RDLI-65 TaxID=3111641 RepID=UPI003C1981D4